MREPRYKGGVGAVGRGGRRKRKRKMQTEGGRRKKKKKIGQEFRLLSRAAAISPPEGRQRPRCDGGWTQQGHARTLTQRPPSLWSMQPIFLSFIVGFNYRVRISNRATVQFSAAKIQKPPHSRSLTLCGDLFPTKLRLFQMFGCLLSQVVKDVYNGTAIQNKPSWSNGRPYQ